MTNWKMTSKVFGTKVNLVIDRESDDPDGPMASLSDGRFLMTHKGNMDLLNELDDLIEKHTGERLESGRDITNVFDLLRLTYGLRTEKGFAKGIIDRAALKETFEKKDKVEGFTEDDKQKLVELVFGAFPDLAANELPDPLLTIFVDAFREQFPKEADHAYPDADDFQDDDC